MKRPSDNLLRSFGFALKGIITLIRQERNVRIHLFATVVVIIFGIIFNPNYALELRYEGQKCNKISRFIDFSIAPLW